MLKTTWRWLMVSLGGLSLAVGMVGVFLPLLPTTPFVLLAAFFFARGSTRMHRWLAEHPRFGRYLVDWQREQVIPPFGKYASTLTMVPSVAWVTLTREIPWPLEVMMAATAATVLWFIWSRPSHPSVDRTLAPAPAADDGTAPRP